MFPPLKSWMMTVRSELPLLCNCHNYNDHQITSSVNHAAVVIHSVFFFICYLFSCLAIIIGFTNTNYTVDEGIGTLQVDVQVFHVPDNQPLPTSVALVIQTVSGSASKGTEPVYLTSILILSIH